MSWREKYADRLDNLGALSPDELTQLENDLIDEFDAIDGSDNSSLADLSEISATVDQVREQRENSTSSLATLRANIHPPEDEEDEEPGSSEDEDEEATQQEDEVPGKQVQSVAASQRPSLGKIKQRALTPADRAKFANGAKRVTTRLVAAGDIPGFGVGQEITSHESLTRAFMRKLEALGRGGTPDQVLVASMNKEYPIERQLGDDPVLNTQRIEAVTNPQALVAYGGICEPLAVDYSVPTIGSTARPVQAAFPSFNATRGGVQFMVPPVLSSITPPIIWTPGDDEGGTKTKPCMRIICVPNQSATVYAIPVCVEVGNFMGRFNTEQVASQVALLDVAAARVAELTLLSILDAGSIATTSTSVLGATRTTLTTIDKLIAAYRYRYRLGTAPLRVILPEWVRDMIRADMVMELAHDRSGQDNFAITDANIASWFGARQVTAAWAMEDLGNSFGANQGAGALNAWPASFVAYFFAEGTWQFLDGGRLDLGVVRDSVLNSTNDYQIWREDFEGLAKRGNESLKVTVTTAPTGASACCVDTTA